jgi:8-oxo-dGTP pyrophosphatase MutT (NUDIX family)
MYSVYYYSDLAMSTWICNHRTCNWIYAQNDPNLRAGAAGAIVLNRGNTNQHYIAVGRERWGQQAGHYNVAAGGAEPVDHDRNGKLCYCRIMRRELEEEF